MNPGYKLVVVNATRAGSNIGRKRLHEFCCAHWSETMIVECPSCRTKFSLELSALKGVENPRFHCSRCDHYFEALVSRETAAGFANSSSSAEVTSSGNPNASPSSPTANVFRPLSGHELESSEVVSNRFEDAGVEGSGIKTTSPEFSLPESVDVEDHLQATEPEQLTLLDAPPSVYFGDALAANREQSTATRQYPNSVSRMSNINSEPLRHGESDVAFRQVSRETASSGQGLRRGLPQDLDLEETPVVAAHWPDVSDGEMWIEADLTELHASLVETSLDNSAAASNTVATSSAINTGLEKSAKQSFDSGIGGETLSRERSVDIDHGIKSENDLLSESSSLQQYSSQQPLGQFGIAEHKEEQTLDSFADEFSDETWNDGESLDIDHTQREISASATEMLGESEPDSEGGTQMELDKSTPVNVSPRAIDSVEIRRQSGSFTNFGRQDDNLASRTTRGSDSSAFRSRIREAQASLGAEITSSEAEPILRRGTAVISDSERFTMGDGDSAKRESRRVSRYVPRGYVPRDRKPLSNWSSVVAILSVPLFLCFACWLVGGHPEFLPAGLRASLYLQTSTIPRVPPKGLGLVNLESAFITLDDGNRVLEIRGELLNTTPLEFGKVKLEARVFDDLNAEVGSVVVNSINAISNARIESLTLPSIQEMQRAEASDKKLIEPQARLPVRIILTPSTASASNAQGQFKSTTEGLRTFSARVHSIEPT